RYRIDRDFTLQPPGYLREQVDLEAFDAATQLWHGVRGEGAVDSGAQGRLLFLCDHRRRAQQNGRSQGSETMFHLEHSLIDPQARTLEQRLLNSNLEAMLVAMERILVINPNSTQAVTDGIDRAMEPLRMSGGPAIECVTIKEGPPGIETQAHVESVVAPISNTVRARDNDCSAFVIACYSDPGLHAAREVTTKP